MSVWKMRRVLIDAAVQTAGQSAALDEMLGGDAAQRDAAHVRRLSLRHTLNGRDPEQQTAFQ